MGVQVTWLRKLQRLDVLLDSNKFSSSSLHFEYYFNIVLFGKARTWVWKDCKFRQSPPVFEQNEQGPLAR